MLSIQTTLCIHALAFNNVLFMHQVWSIRHLRESTATDGKAAASLKKLRLFRQFYVMVLAYIYTTRILVYLISNSMPFR